MENLYNDKLKSTRQVIEKLNPLSAVLSENYLNSLIQHKDVLSMLQEDKKHIRKLFRSWTGSNHPDKWGSRDIIDDSYKEVVYFIYQVFADAFTKCEDDCYDSVWMFMGYSVLTFHGMILDQLNVIVIHQVSPKIDDMMLFSTTCRILSNEIFEMMETVKNNLLFFENYLSLEQRNICMLHSTELNLIEKVACPPCNLIVISDDSDIDSVPDGYEGIRGTDTHVPTESDGSNPGIEGSVRVNSDSNTSREIIPEAERSEPDD